MTIDLGADAVDWRYKGLLAAPGTRVDELGACGLNVLRGDIATPLVTLRRNALRHNIGLMARFCDEHACLLAPHAKTNMSPELWRMQLDAGAWGLTVATFAQTRALRAFGVPRVLLANQLVDRVALHWVARELKADPAFDFYCLVDSIAAVRLMEAALDELGDVPPLQVLVELGYPGGRAGCRDVDSALEVAAAVAASDRLLLRGVEGFEGYLGDDESAATIAAVDGFLDGLGVLARAIAERGLAGGGPILVSAGGSVYFDRVVARLGGLSPAGSPFQLILRSGCYVSHDAGLYRRLSPLDGRSVAAGGGRRLASALDLWATVISRPEPELAIANFGKRDAGQDAGLPVPHSVVRDGLIEPAPDALEVILLHDQHAHLRVPPDHGLAVGDMIGCGVSHPCTTFDKWRLIPLIDERHDVVDAIHVFL